MSGAEKRVCVGAIAGAHGVQGAVRIKSFTADPERCRALWPARGRGGRAALFAAPRRQREGRGDRRASRESPTATRPRRCAGMRLYLPRAALPPTADEEYYHADLIGLEAVLADGTPVGRVRAVHDFGAGDTLEIERASGPAGDGAVHPRGRAGRRSRRRPAGARSAAGPASTNRRPPRARRRKADDHAREPEPGP